MIARAALVALAAVAGSAGQATADAVVTACQGDAQAGGGVNLAQALAGGGVIRFNCPAGSVIRVEGRYDLPGSTLIDGGGAVTLDGGGLARTAFTTRQNIILRRINLQGFAETRSALGSLPGAVLAFGDAELDQVSVAASRSPFKFLHRATVTDSTFIGNFGVVIDVNGEARIAKSRFVGNETALFMGEGSIRNVNFQNNSRGTARISGADGAVEVLHSTFQGTKGGPALAFSAQARRPGLTMSVRANQFRDNEAGGVDIFDLVREAQGFNLPPATINGLMRQPPASFALSYNRFTGNKGARGAALSAELGRAEKLASTGDLFVGNTATAEGGAILVHEGLFDLAHAVLKGNRAGGRGAAVAVEAGRAVVSNSLLVGNIGPESALAGGNLTLANVTLAENEAAGLAMEAQSGRASNVILSHNRPADCARLPANLFQGRNIATDASCPGLTPSEPFLDAFFTPAPGGPAARGGDRAACRAAPVDGLDLAFQPRLASAGCSLGAFEQAPVAKLVQRTDRREPHADAGDDFSEQDGYRPPPTRTSSTTPTPPGPPSPPPVTLPATDAVLALGGFGVDFSVPERDLREWLANPRFTPYPALAAALLDRLKPRGLRQPVYIDVIAWNYEHAPGVRSPRAPGDVRMDVLEAAIVEGYNTRHAAAARTMAEIMR